MIQKSWTLLGLLATTFALTACGDKPQELGAVKQDAAPYSGVGKSQYQLKGWSVGDKNSWEQQLKARAQYGMNDYSRVVTK